MLNGGNPLTVGVGIVIEVIRKNNSDYDPDVGAGVDNIPSSRDPIYLGTLLRLFAKHVPDFMKLILTQCMVVTNEDGSKTEKRRELKAAFGETIEPLGFDRFKTCELMAELLHCSNMGLLNEKGGERYVKERDRERDRLRAERERERQDVERANDINGSIEGVVVEKAPLQVQNGGAEIDEDGLNEDEFEDVAVSGLLEEVRGATGQNPTGGLSKDVALDEPKDTKMSDEDVFVDEPLSPAALAVDAPPASASCSTAPAPPPTPADSIPQLDSAPILARPSDVLGQSVPPNDLAAKAPGAGSDPKDEKMEDAPLPPPPPPEKDDDKASVSKDFKGPEGKAQQEGSSKVETIIEGDLMITDVPKAPSPPPAEGDDDNGNLLKGGRSLVDDLKTASIAAPLNPQASSISQDRIDADLPPLPKEAFEKPKQPDDPEEDLLDLGGGSPYSTTTFRSTGNSSFEEYETMIEKDFEGNPVVGDYLKMMFVENSVVPTILVCCGFHYFLDFCKLVGTYCLFTGFLLPISLEQLST